jgi:DNA-binding CsgD family transcriptional regulator
MKICDIPGLADDRLKLFLGYIAKLNRQESPKDFFAALTAMLNQLCSINSLVVLEFNRRIQPRLIFVDGPGGGKDLSQYLGGLYQLDPFFYEYETHGRTGVFTLDHEGFDNCGRANSYKRYWQQIAGDIEVAASFELATDRCLHLSVMMSRQADNEKNVCLLLEALEEIIGVCFSKFTDDSTSLDMSDEARRRSVHQAVGSALENFGSDVLTDRERDVVQLLLRGYSAKAIGRMLEISPGTARIHRSNIYHKLDVSGQGDLFGKYITQLSQM